MAFRGFRGLARGRAFVRHLSTETKAKPAAAASAAPAAPEANRNTSEPLTSKDIRAAYNRIKGTVQKSPLDESIRLSAMTGCDLLLKKEHISIVGSYKERGALNKLLSLSEEQKARGVICSSAGNHAQAVSHHSTRLGIHGVIVMPMNAPVVKIRQTRAFGGKVVLAGETFAEAYEHALMIAEKEGLTFIHAFDDREVVAGQGTVGLELLEQNAYLDAVVVPVGGGGLIAGMAVAMKQINPRIKIYGVEAEAMPGMHTSLRNGSVKRVMSQPTMADGIAIENVGAVPYREIEKHVDDIVLVDESEIASAVLTLLEVEKTVVEGSGATGLAALMSDKLPMLKGQTVATIITGGNIDMTLLGRIIDQGLVKDGRLARLRVTILDRPGNLARVMTILAEHRANIVNINHKRAFLLESVHCTQPMIDIETKGFDHIQEIIAALKAAGYEKTFLDTPTDL